MTTLTSAYAILQHATIGNQGNAQVDDAPYYRPEKKMWKSDRLLVMPCPGITAASYPTHAHASKWTNSVLSEEEGMSHNYVSCSESNGDF